jgi:F-type H+-transporting ATPase subunit delta
LRDPAIARNYAEALFAVGERFEATEPYAQLLDAFAGAVETDLQIRVMLESPRVPKGQKLVVLDRALEGRVPAPFLRWVEALVRRGRQTLIGAINREYQALMDIKLNRVHAGVTLARRADPAMRDEIVRRLSEALEKEVIPHFREDPTLLGGVVVRIGDTLIDGSVRQRMAQLRRQMLGM